MKTLEELQKLCAASVTLSINKHRDYHESVETHLNNLSSLLDGLETEQSEIDKMITTNTVVELQFYPRSPGGSYILFGASIDYVLSQITDKMFE